VLGADRAEFLNRMTTNDINSLRSGQTAVTVLTSPTARIRFVFTVLCLDEELLLLPASGQSDALAAHLRGQIFFMDQVEVNTNDSGRWRLAGPQAEAVLDAAGYPAPGDSDGRWWQSGEVVFVWEDRLDVPGFEIVASTDAGEELVTDLVAGGAVLLTDPAAYEIRRIELGVPAPGHELTEDYSPLEVGLDWACSDSKGCYTGQEIIARQITYDKVTKKLVGLVTDQLVSEGSAVIADGKKVGKVTSAIYSPTMNTTVGLAVVQRSHNEAGTPVSVQGEEGMETAARIVGLPFESDSNRNP
jgi:folate-binding protein YgfZ